MLTAESAAALFQVNRRAVYQLVETKTAHFSETENGLVLLCWSSLEAVFSSPLPKQLSATDGITIGIPAFFLALMPNTRRYQAGFLKRSLSFAAPAGLIIALAVLSINTYSRLAAQGTGPAVRTGSVLVLTLIALWVLVVLSRPLNRWRVLIIGVMYAALLLPLAVPPLGNFLISQCLDKST